MLTSNANRIVEENKSETRRLFDTLIGKALAYALSQARLEERETDFIITEFFHSLNRKGVIRSDEVEPLITYTKALSKGIPARPS